MILTKKVVKIEIIISVEMVKTRLSPPWNSLDNILWEYYYNSLLFLVFLSTITPNLKIVNAINVVTIGIR